ncbi:MAG: prepilin-type N-terminal cleavage/methylation domain-containing protein [Halarsenatibacteraceae bacterium]
MKIIKSNQGFTLVEMLLVLVVIGILTSISIPGLAGVRGQADATAVQLEMSGIKNLLEVEYLNNNYLYPKDQTEFDELDIAGKVSYIYKSDEGKGKDYTLESENVDGYYYKTSDLSTAITRVNEPVAVPPVE